MNKEQKEFNGYSFDKKDHRKKMKYIVIYDGDLDLNGAYAFKSKKDLEEYIKDSYHGIQAVFKIEDITNKL